MSRRHALGRGVLASTFLRSLSIQGSWNYHTMLGSGLAFALLPGLRRLHADPADFEAAVDRHLDHFNAHPYLAGVALGAVLRLEADGADPETIRRFKIAVRGPLGGLGDTLVWATWLPGVALVALIAHFGGAPMWVATILFLGVYNIGHLALRVWGIRVGLAEGQNVGRALGRADLAGRAARAEPLLTVLIGTLLGILMGGGGGWGAPGVFWVASVAVAFLLGALGGHRVWRPAAVLTVAAIAILAAYGVFR